VSTKSTVVAVGLRWGWIALQATAPRRSNPAVDAAEALDARAVPPPVLDVLRRSCFDCHSSETTWPWYASVAPMSWLVVSDVNDGRGQLNFSRWNVVNPYDRADLLDKMCELVTDRTMPMWQYRLAHPSARLSDAEVAAVCAWTGQAAEKLVGAG
jgi:hypothetical protein